MGPFAFQAAIGVFPRYRRATSVGSTCNRRTPRCLLSNINQVPLEPIPENGALPKHWSKAGVYGVYDKNSELQYVASVLNVGEAIENHRIVLNDPNRVHSVRMIIVDDPDTAPLDELARNWVLTTVNVTEPPPGNCEVSPEWRVKPEKDTGPDVLFRQGASDARLEIMHILRRHRIVLFMKGTYHEPMCGFSYQTLEILKDMAGDKLKVVNCLDAENNPDLRETIKTYSEWPTIPQLYVNGDFVGGADIVASLAESGELQSMIDEAAAQPVYHDFDRVCVQYSIEMAGQHSYLPSFVSPVFVRHTSFAPSLHCVASLRHRSAVRPQWCRQHHSYFMSMGRSKSTETVTNQSADPSISIQTHETTPIEGQKTGTSGLRRRTSDVISNVNFVPNFVQSLFNALGGREELSGKTLVVGGDGRYYNNEAIQIIIRMAAANGFGGVIVGRNGILSTPAVSGLIPKVGAFGGIVLTASHNPGGPDADWGIKYNTQSGAPALEALTDKIYSETLRIKEYHIANLDKDVDLSSIELTEFHGDGIHCKVQVIDSVFSYRFMLEEVFDFNAIRKLISREDFSLCFDAMHAVTGEYAHQIFVDLLGADPSCILRGETLPDFGGGHPDPNLTYAKDLVSRMKADDAPSFGAASDGDGDRNMILGGGGVFVNPADSVAIIVDHAVDVIPYFRPGLRGVARSMPTASALDRVAAKRDIPLYETPTGWKFFSNLMDAEMLSICGEESFGTGSNHVREKDGLWAVMCWLSILAHKNRDRPIGELFTVKDVLLEHWKTYGRTYALRHDYENVSASAGADVMSHLRNLMLQPDEWPSYVARMDEFEYIDPVDCSKASKQGVRTFMKDGARVVIRLSGTGSMGATVRIYFETYEFPVNDDEMKNPAEVLEQVVERAKSMAKLLELTGRDAPTVIT